MNVFATTLAHAAQRLTGLSSFALIARAAAHSGRSDPQRRGRCMFKFWAHALCHPLRTVRWLRSLDDPCLRPYALREPRLPGKPQRPYLNRQWSFAQRTDALLSHYRWCAGRLEPAALDGLYAGRAIRLCDLALRPDGTRASIWLDRARHQTREGELALLLCTGEPVAATAQPMQPTQPVPLVTLSFSVVRGDDGRHHFTIGCVQAAAHARLSDFKALTKAMHGLRPKSLLVRAAQCCALAWQTGLRGIDPAAHPFTSWRYRLSPLKHGALAHMRESYHALWHDNGGALPDANGWVRLPTQAVVKSRAEIEVSKRSLYERRGKLVDDMQEQLRHALAGITQRTLQADAQPIALPAAPHVALPVTPHAAGG